MKIQIHISDADYRDLISTGRRLQGTIGLINTEEATFNRHHLCSGRPQAPGYRFRKLAHGRVSVTDERVRLTLSIDRSEADLLPADAIDEESQLASYFVMCETED